MSFKTVLLVDDEQMNVLRCSFPLSQSVDANGRPKAIPIGGNIELLVESSSSTSLFDWMINATQTKSGVIRFFRRDQLSNFKTLEFTDAYCIAYEESFIHDGDEPMQINLRISAREIKLNGSVFKNNWPDR